MYKDICIIRPLRTAGRESGCFALATWQWTDLLENGSSLPSVGGTLTGEFGIPPGFSVQRFIAMGGIQNAKVISATSPDNAVPVMFTWRSILSLNLAGKPDELIAVTNGIVRANWWQATASGGPSVWSAWWWTPSHALDYDLRVRRKSTGEGSQLVYSLTVGRDNPADPGTEAPESTWFGQVYLRTLFSYNPL